MTKKNVFVLSAVFLALPVASMAAGGSFDRDLYFGMRADPDVTRLQEFLRGQGFFQGEATGNFFSLTRSAVQQFQMHEHIVPASGYFGPLTRGRANMIFGGPGGTYPSNDFTAQGILAKIQALQAQLKMLQDKLAQEKMASTSPVVPAATSTVTDMSAPAFTRAPYVADAGFVLVSPFGAHYPYRVRLDWATDAQGTVNESVSCTPSFKANAAAGHSTQFFLEPHTSYSCTIDVINQQGKKASQDISFASPSWVNMAGSATSTFPDIMTTPLKLGDFVIYNGTTSDVLLSSIDVLLSEAMDSSQNRGHKVSFLLRDGTTTTDTLISQTDFTFVSTAPQLGDTNRSTLSFPTPLSLHPGEERKISLWVEQLNYVKSGTLEIAGTKLNTTATFGAMGTFDFILTKAPGL